MSAEGLYYMKDENNLYRFPDFYSFIKLAFLSIIKISYSKSERDANHLSAHVKSWVLTSA
jgi:hypothetical protein